MDKIRKITDKRLELMEREMGRVYRTDPALLAIQQEYEAYMDMVQKRTHLAYVRFASEKDVEQRMEYKRAYQEELENLTLKSPEYQDLIDRFTTIMAQANQRALDIANSYMRKIYVDNYNQVATECRRVGIKVNGEEEE